MNLIEAIKSGRSFRRRGHQYWMKTLNNADVAEKECGVVVTGFSPSEVTADDWEIKEPTVTITRQQFYDAVMIARRKMTGKPIAMWHASRRDHFPDAFEVALALGLEEIVP